MQRRNDIVSETSNAKKRIFFLVSKIQISNRGEGEGEGPMGLDLTCDRRAATVSGDGDGGRRLSFWREVGDGD